MTGQRGDFLHRGVAPDVDLVLAVAMGRYKLVDVLCEHEVANLAAGLYRLDVL